MDIRIGIGYDSHRFVKGNRLFLGGIQIEYEFGLQGHSDGDALIHSLIDALLGAAKLPNIGELFPESDQSMKGISSINLLLEAVKLVKEKGYSVVNADCVIIAEKPKLSIYAERMEEVISKALEVSKEKVNIKAKTNELMGFIGQGEGVACFSVVLLKK